MNKLDGILLMPHAVTDPVELESRLTATITSSADRILWRLAMATCTIGDLNRREILKMSAMTGVASVVSTRFAMARTVVPRTPEQILGPFYPLKPLDQNADLTRVPGRPGRAEGQILTVTGRVLNLNGEPVRNAKIEIWQANAHGRYTHPSDTNPAPLDPNFEGAAVLTTDDDGRYRFETIKPAAYPVGPHLMRPAHIHFQVSGRQDRLVTKMYFEGDPYNATDRILQTAGRTELLIAKLLPPTAEMEPKSKLAVFDIVLYAG
jgi:protocatechuate 3,4-dioxygenase beta subunit